METSRTPTCSTGSAPAPDSLLDDEKTGATLMLCGVLLTLVGVIFTVMGWQHYKDNPTIQWNQLLGPILISIGGITQLSDQQEKKKEEEEEAAQLADRKHNTEAVMTQKPLRLIKCFNISVGQLSQYCAECPAEPGYAFILAFYYINLRCCNLHAALRDAADAFFTVKQENNKKELVYMDSLELRDF
ncbi:uncharacterized protein V6R79_025336 [Siganus canaliculatus]